MAQTAKRLDFEPPRLEAVPDLEHDDKHDEVPTNYLDSAHLHSTTLEASNAPSEPIDFVSALSRTRAFRESTRLRTVSLSAPPTGMYQHSTPARMVPARTFYIPGLLRRVLLSVLLPALLIGGLVWTLYTYVGFDWVTGLFTPTSPAQTSETTDPASTGSEAGTAAQPGTGVAAPLPIESGTPQELYARGVDSYKKGDYDQAIHLLNSAVTIGTEDAIIYYQLGLSYLGAVGRPYATDDAELAFRTAVSLQPEWAAGHKMLAESLIRGGFYVEAIGPALEATRLDPLMGDAWLTLSRAYKGAGKETEATAAYAEAARLFPPPPTTGD